MTKEREHRLISLWGNRCVNCGSTDEIEWQYIVPLCSVCGYARRNGINVDEARKILGK